jgi:hypothetical protein
MEIIMEDLQKSINRTVEYSWSINIKESKSAYNRDTCTYMFIAAVFTKAK